MNKKIIKNNNFLTTRVSWTKGTLLIFLIVAVLFLMLVVIALIQDSDTFEVGDVLVTTEDLPFFRTDSSDIFDFEKGTVVEVTNIIHNPDVFQGNHYTIKIFNGVYEGYRVKDVNNAYEVRIVNATSTWWVGKYFWIFKELSPSLTKK